MILCESYPNLSFRKGQSILRHWRTTRPGWLPVDPNCPRGYTWTLFLYSTDSFDLYCGRRQESQKRHAKLFPQPEIAFLCCDLDPSLSGEVLYPDAHHRFNVSPTSITSCPTVLTLRCVAASLSHRDDNMIRYLPFEKHTPLIKRYQRNRLRRVPYTGC
jgi:hypothetical protein